MVSGLSLIKSFGEISLPGDEVHFVKTGFTAFENVQNSYAVPEWFVVKGFERYVHDIDCSAYDPKLRLRSFSVLYPGDYVVEDCREDPGCYVQFSRYYGERRDSSTAHICIGSNTISPFLVNIIGYKYLNENNKVLFDQIIAGIRVQVDSVKIVNRKPVEYRGGTFYRRDYVAEKHAQGTIHGRMVAIPNFDTGDGILMSFAVSTDAISKAVFQEFDTGEFNTMFESLVASLKFDFIGKPILRQIKKKDLSKLKQEMIRSFEDKLTLDIEGFSMSSYMAHTTEVTEFLQGIKNDLMTGVGREYPSYEEAYLDSIINVKLSYERREAALVYGLYFEGTYAEPPDVPEEASLMLGLCKELIKKHEAEYEKYLKKIFGHNQSGRLE